MHANVSRYSLSIALHASLHKKCHKHVDIEARTTVIPRRHTNYAPGRSKMKAVKDERE